ncbi:SUMF1/EgtB/PvdO family nonheme iron enzyme [Gloeocapsa sp. PCC 73106]|uniref:formylglycine-generating enzyme family protein n=1 Tax=Gloeocapsa sp. PCC 73106 TaxID=102232 RepID=UPI0002ACE2FB|nr:SUMF1/EgtB/PvdO family nonheme iron enzyme [Gloeocapsa sp. PCC 73106]ELR96754.1 hypothetical protein GLO73106DRAFT_00005520 [Gloeocapsa sp. PCC 73106]
MPWRLIDDGSAIDTDLITCAEYQLFIDETEVNRRPLHWENSRFVPGTAKNPVTGVKPEDALAFCAWLNRQEVNSGFKYRLPTVNEANQSLIAPASVGYWCTNGENILLEGIDLEQWQIWEREHCQLLKLSCVQDLVNGLIFLLESILDLDISLILIIDRSLSKTRKYAVTSNRVRARNHALKRVREQVRNLGLDLVQELTRTEALALEFKKDLIWEQSQIFERLRELATQLDHNLVFDSDVVLDLDLVRDIDLGIKGELTVDLDLAHYLASYREQLLLQTRDFAGLLTLDLAGELTQSLLSGQYFGETVTKMQDLDLKQINYLFRELERTLALNRSLYRHRQKEIELAFNCLKYFTPRNNYTLARSSLLLISACWHWLSCLDYSFTNLPPKEIRSLQKDYTERKKQVLNIYSSFLLLAQRQTGKMPAWEGIRLARLKV